MSSILAETMRRVAHEVHRMELTFRTPEFGRRHRIRCDACSPMANPRPLCIDGPAYHRRQQSRRHRR